MKEIHKEKFDIYTCIHPFPYPFELIGWYANNSESVIASLVLDCCDHNYGYILLGRDKRKIFRTINVCQNFEVVKESAICKLFKLIKRYDEHDQNAIFPQGDETAPPMELFESILPDEKLHPYFKKLCDVDHIPAKAVIRELVYQFKTQDTNYLTEFQTQFSPRLWELFLYFFFYKEKFKIEQLEQFPDFVISKNNHKVVVEATTVNESTKIDINMMTTTENLQANYLPIKYGSSLFSKLKKKYWEHKKNKNMPIIFALHDFHQSGSMLFSETTLREYLYGIKLKKTEINGHFEWEKITEHCWKNKRIPSGFFNLEDADNISAILLATTATIGKFNRVGKLAGFGGDNLAMIREGTLRNPEPDSTESLPFVVSVNNYNYHESWSEGMIMFHNPKAKHPIQWDLFPTINHITFDENEGFKGHFNPYDIVSSVTSTIKF